MRVVVGLDRRFIRTPDGTVWTTSSLRYLYWCRYLPVFDSVSVVARVLDVPEKSGEWQRADGDRVSFQPLPYYLGLRGYLRHSMEARARVARVVTKNDAVVLRAPSHVASLLYAHCRRMNHPLGIEVVGDPHDAFAPGAYQTPLRPFLRYWLTRTLQRQCRGAATVAYVTEGILQKRYPAAEGVYTTYFSDIDLMATAFVKEPRRFNPGQRAFKLVTVGSLAHPYKGVDVLLDAVSECLRGGLDLQLAVIGDGRDRVKLEKQAQNLGLGGRVRFVGELPGAEAVRAYLDDADLFVLASRTEGLPKATVEAMARGLPCICTAVGGMVELLPPEDLVPPVDKSALAAKIQEVLSSPERMTKMAARNWEKAREFLVEEISKRRIAFYQTLREITERSLGKQV